jgi:EAL domain-containing protein (putative c-di-GMP-specific phosphodiesterase class I)
LSNINVLANNLKLRVVAEGVESEEQARLLREQGCDMVQGFHYGQPQPSADILKLFKKLNRPVFPTSIRTEERHS